MGSLDSEAMEPASGLGQNYPTCEALAACSIRDGEAAGEVCGEEAYIGTDTLPASEKECVCLTSSRSLELSLSTEGIVWMRGAIQTK